MGYLKETGQLTPEKQMEIEQKINLSYQRLLTFEISGTGGFDWYGKSPAKIILSAYGILLLNDMRKVYGIDERVIDRAYAFLRSQQNEDGSWNLDRGMGTWSQLSNGNLPLTAYVMWALAEAGYRDDTTQRAIWYLERHFHEAQDPYVQALCANALVAYRNGDDPAASDILMKLKEQIREKDDSAWWDTSLQGVTYGRGECADIEATALAAYAFLKAGKEPQLAEKAIRYLIRSKDPSGSWHSTQATILCIKTLLEATRSLSSATNRGEVALFVNGEKCENVFTFFTEKNSDIVQQANISRSLRKGDNEIRLETSDNLNLTYQIAGRYYIPWRDVAGASEETPPLTIAVDYDKTTLRVDETVTAQVRIRYFDAMPTFMAIADVGIPPGFSAEGADLERLVSDRVVDKYSVTGRQITFYLGDIEKGKEVNLSYRLKARYPIKAKAPASSIYEYYSPDRNGSSQPVEFLVE